MTDFYYDGEPFVGTKEGLTHGFLTRQTIDAGDGVTLTPLRAKHDEHGNSIESIDADGSLDDEDTHRRTYTYGPLGIFLNHVDVKVAPGHVLRKSTVYEPLFQQIVEGVDWVLITDGVEASPRNETRFELDGFGRVVSRFEPGDPEEAPTSMYSYDLGEPSSRVTTMVRTERGGDAFTENHMCLDGRGRLFQERMRVEDSTYLVTGFQRDQLTRGGRRDLPTLRGDERESVRTPDRQGVLSLTMTYDAIFRMLTVSEPGTDIYGTRLVSSTTYEPLMSIEYDPEDTNESSPHFDTPTRIFSDGLGRMTSIERTLATGDTAVYGLHYDETGSFTGYTDPAGNRHELIVDLAGRITTVRNPTTGEVNYTYNGLGNVVSQRDARGITTRYTYDGAARLIEKWDEADRDASILEFHYDTVPEGCAVTDCTNVANKLAEISFPTPFGRGTERVGYDSRQQTVFKERRFGDVIAMATRTSFGSAGQVHTMDYTDGTTLTLSPRRGDSPHRRRGLRRGDGLLLEGEPGGDAPDQWRLDPVHLRCTQ